MPRYKREIETRTRSKIDELIDTEALQTDKIVFYPPSYVVAVMDELGYAVTKDYVIRRYHDIGVKNENGLWVRNLL